ncbi:NADP-dependent malic enzyme [Trinickia caryophylli]|uniref:Allosteric NADP-dependent malic enzyme n=1 Tax=Trinickia caryophylli TaxID=28094 RepID=A0A1X7FKU6_TRICW|nr:NADP-dependent malic enzyme [Trinickia caryophylli]PMS13137.1 NADP-dependent malic enzyme [Trinickia caryophylli]TRX19340.1 NADP-dependent malic enzyme [Trinickia caryophylli]WQE13357.1 NADP-dependent malic enzyme [Trinickia caryophylli]SMF54002.1 allosteric NADP-dependent malic enzyme [Trinickia caryophylli]GLU34128.1 malic enzyme [Trinickia caryophylli]
MDEQLKQSALSYHQNPKPGKISVTPTKPLSNQLDLSLAYSPGVAAACEAIHADPLDAQKYTSRGNLVGVITNGTAVLGLGNIGPLAAKPVMEGKGCLFKKFAGIDVFDIELSESDPDKLVEAIAMLEPTLGGINLEDIKAPECFYIEQKLRERMKIPVFHDDQHGTAIIASAAILNGLKVVGKDLARVKLVCSGAGAAAIACLDLLVKLGLTKENILVADSKGVIYEGRGNLDPSKARYAARTEARTLDDAIEAADVFLGCSSAGVLKPEMVKKMGERPLILALANPEPEIRPEDAKAARPDAIIATGRSDYPNQVNNVLCFPFIFRGALDVGATTITEEMKLACVRAIAELAEETDQGDEVAKAYEGHSLEFGPEYLIPKPFDPRLIIKIAPAVAQAAMDSGVATRPIQDMDAYREQLGTTVYRTGMVMRPVFATAKTKAARIVFAEGEDERVLRAAQFVLTEKIARPIIIGRPAVVEMRLKKMGSKLKCGVDFEIVNPEDDPRYQQSWQAYHEIGAREGVTPEVAKAAMRKFNTLIGAILVHLGDADGMICGLIDTYHSHLKFIDQVLGRAVHAEHYAAMNLLMLPGRNLFICDTYVNEVPSAEQLADMAILASREIERFGIVPKVALLSNSNFGSTPSASSQRMAAARRLIAERAPHLEVDGEMHGDAALSEAIRKQAFPGTTLSGEANLLLMPNVEAANITYNLLKMIGGEGVTVGPFLLGAAKPVHILTPAATVRRIINMTAVAAANVVRAQ